MHQDLKANQILIERNSKGTFWWILDFGSSKIEYIDEEDKPIKVPGRYLSTSRTFGEDLTLLVSAFQDALPKASPREKEKGTQWIREAGKLCKGKIVLAQFLENTKTLF